jgi:cytochrome c556
MRRMSWKAGLAGSVLVVTTAYAAAQMGSGHSPQEQMSPEQMTGMMKQMSQMMDRCSTMMQGAPHQHRDPPAPHEKKH